MHVLTVIGARPQFIKAAAVSYAIKAHNARGWRVIRETIVHTGQHYDHELSDVFFHELGLAVPAVNLNVGSESHAKQTGAIMRGLEPLLIEQRPELVLIYGDTNSTLAAALVAAKLNIPIAHVEAGLRSRNIRMPEEINRIVADRLSTLLFTGTDAARQNLAAEGLADRIRDVGDVMLDCVRLYGERAGGERLSALGLTPGRYALATIHRAENTDRPERLQGILEGLRKLARTLPVVVPLHPRTSAVVERFDPQALHGLTVIRPVSYLDMVTLEKGARLILTDSGGVQKEAYWHGVPCVTFRSETEWVETVASGWNRLVATDPSAIGLAAEAMLALDRQRPRPDFYGDGRTADRIVADLLGWQGSGA